MKRQLWGEFSEKQDEATMAKQIEIDQKIMMEKRGKFEFSFEIQPNFLSTFLLPSFRRT
jgi:hypothetical protein